MTIKFIKNIKNIKNSKNHKNCIVFAPDVSGAKIKKVKNRLLLIKKYECSLLKLQKRY